MKRIMKSSATATLATLALALGPASLQAAQITVPTDYPTIQDGVNAAGPGDTVLVLPGTYTISYAESPGWFGVAYIDTPGLQLKAAGPPGSVKIVGVVTAEDPGSWPAIKIGADDVLVEGFDISGFQEAINVGSWGAAGPVVTRGTRITRNRIHDMQTISESAGTGIELDLCSNCEIDHNTIDGGVQGIVLQGLSASGPNCQDHIHHNRAMNTAPIITVNGKGEEVISSGAVGILVGQTPGCALDNNECNNNGNTGIYLASSPNCTAENNKTDNNGSFAFSGMYNAVGDGIGIYIGSSANCTMVNNEANNNTGCGIWVGGPDCTVSNNEANGNASYGIAVIGGGGSTVANNEADNNGTVGSVWSIGIYVYVNSPGCTVVGNETDHNLADGIQTRFSCGSTFAFNVAKGNERYDLSDWDSPPTCNTYRENWAGTAWPTLGDWDVITPPRR